MKLHAFDATVNGERVRAFTRDRAGKKLGHLIRLESGTLVRPHDWRYNRVLRAMAVEGGLVPEILQRVKLIGVAVTRMPPIPSKFHVFDIKLAEADLRVYSSDPDLAQFRTWQRQFELAANGNDWIAVAEIPRGDVEIESADVATRMGITDYRALIRNGFYISIVRLTTGKEHMERTLLFKLRESTRDTGILVDSLEIQGIDFADAPSSISLPRHEQIRAQSNVPTPPSTQQTYTIDAPDEQVVREKLLVAFHELRSQGNAQHRGYALERFLRDLFDLERLEPRESFRILGEQIDGSFVWRHQTHLLEAKWTQVPTSTADLAAFRYKLDGKSVDTRGLFVSVNGYTRDSLLALQRKGDARFICIDGAQLEHAVSPGRSLISLLSRAWRHAGETGEPYLPDLDIHNTS